MRKYKVILEPKAQKQLKKLETKQSQMIQKWIKTNLVGCSDPYIYGKMLKSNIKNIWKYSVGNYRLFSKIYNKHIFITIIKLNHEKEI